MRASRTIPRLVRRIEKALWGKQMLQVALSIRCRRAIHRSIRNTIRANVRIQNTPTATQPPKIHFS